MMQSTQHRLRDDTHIGWQSVSMCLGCHGQMRRRLGDSWTQGHLGTTLIIISEPRSAPEKPETLPMPLYEGLRLNDLQGGFPVEPAA